MTRARLSTSTSVASLVALLLTACGGTNGTPGDPASNGAVSISPQSAALPPNGQQPFTATVSALVDTSVTWRVREVGGGQVNASGLYTAPNGSGIFHVEVASAADPTKFAVAVVTVSGVGSGIEGLHVVGNQIRNAAGQEVRIHGVNRAGTEYACIQGWGFFDGPSDAASLQAIRSWKANAVRIPLNEDCWLGINGVAPAYGGQNYQRAIADYVALVTQQGLVAILDLHWSAPGTTRADAQRPMPDRDHSPTFWSQVANAFKGNSSVIFELFNEPYPDSNQDTTAAWTCWRDGGACPGVGFTAAGMQELVYAVRDAGATNVILLSGVQYSNTLTRWMEFKPRRPPEQHGGLARLQLQHLRQRILLRPQHGPGTGQLPGGGDGDWPGQLRWRLHRSADGLARLARRRLRGLGVEHLGLVPRAHLRLPGDCPWYVRADLSRPPRRHHSVGRVPRI